MNKATDIYKTFYAATGNKEAAKRCVEIFVKEIEKLLTGEFERHSHCWWVSRMQEIREDVQEL